MDVDDHNELGLIAAESLSCKVCRRRKIKCDRRRPCASCAKSNLECVFPQGRRRPTPARISKDTELLNRLKILESELHTLRTSVVNKSADEHTEARSPSTSVKSTQEQSPELHHSSDAPTENLDSIVADFGRLDIRSGRSRYTSNTLWASLSQEIASMQELLDDDNSEDDGASPPLFRLQSTPWPGRSGLLLGLSSSNYHPAVLHPTKAQMMILWSAFEQNVLPVVKVFHPATTKTLFETAAAGHDDISPTNEAVLFSIYYAAVVSFNAERCQELLGESHARLVAKYRGAAEQCFHRVDFLNTSAFKVLQAFTLFVICTRRHDDTRLIVAWCATAVRIAQCLGLHRDGSKFGLDPFQTEMRRRVWWHLLLLDTDSARDHGIDPSVDDCAFDTQMPLNIDDGDLHPDMTVPPPERRGFTDMTNCIARFEISLIFRQLSYVPLRPGFGPTSQQVQTFEDKQRQILALQSRLDEKYLQHIDHSVPLQFATAVYTRSACAMLWSIIHHPLQRSPSSLSTDTQDRLFASMVEVIENTRLLECNPGTAHWGWYFHNDVQWSAIAYVLNELLIRPPGPSITRAWKVVDAARRQWDADSSTLQKGMLWRAVKSMTAKAGLLDDANGPRPRDPLARSPEPAPLPAVDQPIPPRPALPDLPAQNASSTQAPRPAFSVNENITGVDNFPQQDPWLLLEEDFIALPPEGSLAACDFNKKDDVNVGPTPAMNADSETFSPRQNAWWSLMDNAGSSQWSI